MKKFIDEKHEEVKLEVKSVNSVITYLVEASIEQDGCNITEYKNVQDVSKIKTYLETTLGNTVEAKAVIDLVIEAFEPTKD